MLLRRVTRHVKDQNWFAVFIDFLIVVVGVFIGIQVANWNDERVNKAEENAIVVQLHDEFTAIETALKLQIEVRQEYIEDLGLLVAAIENTDLKLDDIVIKRALHAARSTGRLPAESSAFVQLKSNNGLALLSNNDLKKALISYHAMLERDSYLFPELTRLVIEEWKSNQFVDHDSNTNSEMQGAAIDQKKRNKNGPHLNSIRSFDFDGLRQYESRYEIILQLHKFLINTDKRILEFVNKILAITSLRNL